MPRDWRGEAPFVLILSHQGELVAIPGRPWRRFHADGEQGADRTGPAIPRIAERARTPDNQEHDRRGLIAGLQRPIDCVPCPSEAGFELNDDGHDLFVRRTVLIQPVHGGKAHLVAQRRPGTGMTVKGHRRAGITTLRDVTLPGRSARIKRRCLR
jgi:hypothetical protein